MAAAYVKIICNDIEVRTFGGCKSEAKEVKQQYEGMSKEQFLLRHPKFASICQDAFCVKCDFYNK